MAYFLVVVSVLASLVEGVFIKKYNAKHSHGGFIFTSIVSLFSMLYFLISNKFAFDFSPELLPYAVISGLLFCMASVLTYIALTCGSFSMSMLILSYGIVFPIVYGIVYIKEPVTLFSLVGFALLAISLFLTRGQKVGGKISVKWIVCILLSFFGSGMFSVVRRMQQIRFEDAYNNEFMIITLGISAFVLLAAGLIVDGKHLKEIARYGVPFAALAGFSNGIANMLSIVVNTFIPISLSSPLSSGVKIVISFIVSRMLFKEKYLPRQIVGVAVGALALVFLNI